MSKPILLALVLAYLPFVSSSQIAIDPYPIEVRSAIEDLPLVPPVTAKSLSGTVTTHIEEQIYSGGCLGTMVRTYLFEDKLGNKTTAEQYIYLSDNKAPDLIGLPADMAVDKNNIPPPPMVSCKDNSGRHYIVYYSEAQTQQGLVRWWNCTDDCDNKTEAKQTITFKTIK